MKRPNSEHVGHAVPMDLEDIRRAFQKDVTEHFDPERKRKASKKVSKDKPVSKETRLPKSPATMLEVTGRAGGADRTTRRPNVEHIRFIDLFAGIGGIRLAFEPYGNCVFSSEWDKNSQLTYIANFKERPWGDITQIEADKIPPHELLLAGFPCQAFSVAGYRKGFKDTRGTLFHEIERILAHHKPAAFLLENVKGLRNHDGGETYRTIKRILEDKLEYQVFDEVLDSRRYANVPQTRERIFFVGFNKEKVPNFADFRFPDKLKLTSTIHKILEHVKQPDKYYYPPSHMYFAKLDEAIKNPDTIYQWRRTYVRENKSNACPTLTANMGTGGHNVPLVRDSYGIRKLTPRECARFQGFPDEYVLPNDLPDTKKYYQVGNSVTVTLVERIAKQMMSVLGVSKRQIDKE